MRVALNPHIRPPTTMVHFGSALIKEDGTVRNSQVRHVRIEGDKRGVLARLQLVPPIHKDTLREMVKLCPKPEGAQ